MTGDAGTRRVVETRRPAALAPAVHASAADAVRRFVGGHGEHLAAVLLTIAGASIAAIGVGRRWRVPTSRQLLSSIVRGRSPPHLSAVL